MHDNPCSFHWHTHPRRPFWASSLKELSAWTRYCESMPGLPSAFSTLANDVKTKLISTSPLRVCKYRYPQFCEYVENRGGLQDCWMGLGDDGRCICGHVRFGESCKLFVNLCVSLHMFLDVFMFLLSSSSSFVFCFVRFVVGLATYQIIMTYHELPMAPCSGGRFVAGCGSWPFAVLAESIIEDRTLEYS